MDYGRDGILGRLEGVLGLLGPLGALWESSWGLDGAMLGPDIWVLGSALGAPWERLAAVLLVARPS